jgi:hypothetical protein
VTAKRSHHSAPRSPPPRKKGPRIVYKRGPDFFGLKSAAMKQTNLTTHRNFVIVAAAATRLHQQSAQRFPDRPVFFLCAPAYA